MKDSGPGMRSLHTKFNPSDTPRFAADNVRFRLELFQLQETLKELQKKTKTELAYFQYIEGFAVYARDGNKTMKICFGSGETIGEMKKMKCWRCPSFQQ